MAIFGSEYNIDHEVGKIEIRMGLLLSVFFSLVEWVELGKRL